MTLTTISTTFLLILGFIGFNVLPISTQASPPSAYTPVFLRFLGGVEFTSAHDIALDSAGNIYVVGNTGSRDFPILGTPIERELTNSFQTSFVQKYTSDGDLKYSSFLGGCRADRITVDSDGYVYVTGTYSSADQCVTSDALQDKQSGNGIFVMKVDLNVGKIVYSAHIGGKAGGVTPTSIAVDRDANVFVAGYTDSTDFPTTANAFQSKFIKTSKFGSHGLVAKLDQQGRSLIYSTLLQGDQDEMVLDMAIDLEGNAVVTGWTKSRNFPVKGNAFQSKNNAFAGEANVFVTIINRTGSDLAYSTFIGGSDASGGSIAINEGGDVFVSGITYYDDFPTTNKAYQTKFRGKDENIFVLKFNPNKPELKYSTLIGGSRNNIDAGIAVDKDGKVFLVGRTNAGNFPVTKNAYQSRAPVFNLFKALRSDTLPYDAFISVLNESGTDLIYSSYLGGSDHDYATGVSVDRKGNVFIIGSLQSKKIPSLKELNKGEKDPKMGDKFLFKFTPVR